MQRAHSQHRFRLDVAVIVARLTQICALVFARETFDVQVAVVQDCELFAVVVAVLIPVACRLASHLLFSPVDCRRWFSFIKLNNQF